MHELLFEMDWVPGFRSDALTVVFTLITQLASSWFLLLFMPLGFWLWRKGTFGRLAVLNLLTLLLNSHLKAVYLFPRPDPSFSIAGFSGWSFPSGHAQHAVVTNRVGQRWRLLITALLAGSIILVIQTGGYLSIDSAVPALLHFSICGVWTSLIAPGLLQKLRLGER